MRRFYIALLFALPLIQVAQNLPQHINYQAILRNQNGEELAPNTAAAISFSIYNSVSDPVTSPAYVETHNINVPATKVISLKIGQGTVSGSGTFSSINWAGGEVNYLVGVNGSAVGNRQVFSSVPYALYSVSSGTSAASYSFTSNFTNNSGTVDLSNSGVTSGTYGSNAGLNSRWSTVTLDDKGRVTSASDYAANTKGDISGKLDSQYVAKLRNVPLSNLTPTVGQIMQYNGSGWGPANMPPGAQTTTLVQGNGITINGTAPLYTINAIPANIGAANGLTVVGTAPNFSLAPVTNASVGVWSTLGNSGTNGSNNWIGTNDNNPFIIRVGNVNRVFINHLSGNVGIGLMNPAYRLHSQTTNGAAPIFGDNAGTGNNPQAYGILGSSASTNTLSAGLFGQSLGAGSGVIGTTSATARAAIYGENFAVTSNSLAYGILGVSNNLNSISAGVAGQHNGQGIGVLGTNATNTTAVLGVNTSSANNPFGNGVVGITSSSHTAAIAVFGENKGGGIGVFGRNTNPVSSSAIGVYGLVSNTVSPGTSGVRGDSEGFGTGIQGVNFGNGIAVEGWQVGSGTGSASHAGRFRITGIGNNASALLAATNGTGAAVHAQVGTALTSKLSLLLENGHVKSLGASPSMTIVGFAGGFTSPPLSYFVTGTDVKGSFSFSTSATGFTTTNFVDVAIIFNKSYDVPPTVVLTPASDFYGLDYYIISTTTTNFVVRLFRPSSFAMPASIPANTNFRFNYMIIE